MRGIGKVLPGRATILVLCVWDVLKCAGVPVTERSPDATQHPYEIKTIPGQYVITLKPGVSITEANRWMLPLIDQSPTSSLRHMYDILADASDNATAGTQQHNGTRIPAFRGYACNLSSEALQQVQSHPDVLWVEADQQVGVHALQLNPPWNLVRITQQNHPLGTSCEFPDEGGADVDVYVIDTGVNVHHEQFDGGRAIFGADFTGEGVEDWNGHGTHIAGTVAGRDVGVAKKANIIAVKVLDVTGLGSWSNVIAGINWMVAKVVKTRRKSVANISIGGPRVLSVNSAIETAIAAGIHFTVAAGNNGADACSFSPASANGVVSVGAIGYFDDAKSWSNYGPCVTLYAPGENILSASYIDNTSLKTLSGTSMASPHAAGMMALALGKFRFAPLTLKDLLYNHTAIGLVRDIPTEFQTPNRILQIFSPKLRSKGSSSTEKRDV